MHEDQGSQIHKRNNKSFSLKLIESVVSKIEEQTEKTYIIILEIRVFQHNN